MSDILTQHGRWPTHRGEILMGLSSEARPKELSDISGLRYWNDAYICATTQVEDNNAVDIVVRITHTTDKPYSVDEDEMGLLFEAHWAFSGVFIAKAKDRLGSCAVLRTAPPQIRSIKAKRRGPSAYETEIVVAETFLIDTGDFPEGKRQPEHVAGTLPYLATDRARIVGDVIFSGEGVKHWCCRGCGAKYFTASSEPAQRAHVPHSVDCPVLEAQDRVEFLERAQPELIGARA